jgi:helicase
MKTADFPYLNFGFEEFNKPQSQAVKFADQDCNLITALNTSTGKTAIAMCFFGHELATQKDTKVVYASPLKAISEERMDDLKNYEEWAEIPSMINTGDYMASPEDFERSRIILLTSETLDSKSRNPKIHSKWLEKVGVLVLDEMHLLDEPVRGAALEAGLVNFTKINPNARIVGLSATMSNAKEIASWLKFLNGKPTYCVSSDWRPVKLKKIWLGVRKSDDRWQTEQDMADEAVRICKNNPEDKTLLFVHSKRIGKSITELLNKKGVKAAFYHSGLKPEERRFLGEQFKNKLFDLNVLVTTSALAQGVNL